ELEQELQILCTGEVANEQGKLISLQNEVIQLKDQVANLDIQITSKSNNLKILKDKNTDIEKKIKTFDSSELEKKQKALNEIEKNIEEMNGKIQSLTNFESQLQKEESNRKLLEKDYNKTMHELNIVKKRNYEFEFKYTAPTDNSFDVSKVKGMVYELIRVKDMKYAKALETIAGSRLFNIVTEDEKTASLILKQGKLKRRVHFLPLNKMNAYSINSKIYNYARQNYGEDVQNPCDLIDFDNKYTEIIKYVFGSVMICADMNQGKKLAFDQKIRSNVVTLDGEFFSPQGTLSGGKSARDENYNILKIASSIHHLMDKKSEISNRINQNLINIQNLQHQTNGLKNYQVKNR
ncbi:MAG: Structural maintenance of chromosomes protein 2, partial [Paramarteilia canceri]